MVSDFHAGCSSLAYFIGTSDDLGKLVLLLVLALDDCLDDGGVVAPEVDEDMRDAILPQSLEEGEGSRVAFISSVKIEETREA